MDTFGVRGVAVPRACSIILCAAFGLVPGLALAQSSDSAALRQFEDGTQHFEAGQFERALLAFQGSLSLLPSPNTRLYIARCFRALGKTASAYTSFRLSAREATDRLASTGEKRFSATRDAATSEAAELEPRVPRLTVVVAAQVPEAFQIKLDGNVLPAGAWGTAVEIDPGTHILGATGRRHQALRQEVSVQEGTQQRVEVALRRLPTAVLSVNLRTKPSGLSVLLDNRPIESSELAQPLEVDAGKHTLALAAPGYESYRWQGSLTDNEARSLRIALRVRRESRQASGTPPWLFITALSVGAVAVGTGSYYAVQAQQKSQEQQNLDPLRRDVSVRDDIKTQSLIANLSFGAGALSLVGAGVLLFTTRWSSEEPQAASLSPVVSATQAGVLAKGRF